LSGSNLKGAIHSTNHMAMYKESQQMSGAWAKASDLGGVKSATIISETTPQASQFLDKNGMPKTQDVAKVMFGGYQEPLNVSLNRATINGLIRAFGGDSKNWMNKPLKVETEKVRVAGKSVTTLYLIAEGFIKTDDQNGYAIIVKEDLTAEINADEPMPDDFGQTDEIQG